MLLQHFGADGFCLSVGTTKHPKWQHVQHMTGIFDSCKFSHFRKQAYVVCKWHMIVEQKAGDHSSQHHASWRALRVSRSLASSAKHMACCKKRVGVSIRNEQKQVVVKGKAYFVTSPRGLAEARLGTVNPHDTYLQGLSHPFTPLHHQTHSLLHTDERYWQQLMMSQQKSLLFCMQCHSKQLCMDRLMVILWRALKAVDIG